MKTIESQTQESKFWKIGKYLPFFGSHYYHKKYHEYLARKEQEPPKHIQENNEEEKRLLKKIWSRQTLDIFPNIVILSVVAAYSVLAWENGTINPHEIIDKIKKRSEMQEVREKKFNQNWEKLFGPQGYVDQNKDGVITRKEYREFQIISEEGNDTLDTTNPTKNKRYFVSKEYAKQLEKAIQVYEGK